MKKMNWIGFTKIKNGTGNGPNKTKQLKEIIKMENTTYSIINYFDVWGNKKDGWEVNNLCKEDFTITISDNATTKEIIQALKEEGFLAKHCRENMFEVYNDIHFIEFFRKNGSPVFRLESF